MEQKAPKTLPGNKDYKDLSILQRSLLPSWQEIQNLAQPILQSDQQAPGIAELAGNTDIGLFHITVLLGSAREAGPGAPAGKWPFAY